MSIKSKIFGAVTAAVCMANVFAAMPVSAEVDYTQIIYGEGGTNVDVTANSITEVIFTPEESGTYHFYTIAEDIRWLSFGVDGEWFGKGVSGTLSDYSLEFESENEFIAGEDYTISFDTLKSGYDETKAEIGDIGSYYWEDGEIVNFSLYIYKVEETQVPISAMSSFTVDVEEFVKYRLNFTIEEKDVYLLNDNGYPDATLTYTEDNGDEISQYIRGKTMETFRPNTYTIEIWDHWYDNMVEKGQATFNLTRPETSGTIGDCNWKAVNDGYGNYSIDISGTGEFSTADGVYPWTSYVELIDDVTFLSGSNISIGDYAFSGAKNIWDIELTSLVDEVGEEAFYGCDNIGLIRIYNPECVIYDERYTFPEEATIVGYEGSTAQKYAEKYGRNFESMGEFPGLENGDVTCDGKLNLYDAIEIAKFIMEMVNFTEQGLVTADFNCDGSVNLYDVIAVAVIIMK